MIPQFILDNVFHPLDEGVYYADCNEGGYVIYWVADNETFHTYRFPPDWYVND